MGIERVNKGDDWRPPKADDWGQIADTVDAKQRANNAASANTYLSSISAQTPIGANAVVSVLNPVPADPTDPSFRLVRDYAAENPKAAEATIGNIVAPADSALSAGDRLTLLPDGLVRLPVLINEIVHEFAYPVDGDRTRLQSGGMGYRIVWRETSNPGLQWCVVRLSHFNFTMFWGVTDVAIAAGQSGLVTITKGTIQPTVKYTVHNEIYGEDVGAGVVVTCKHFEPEKCQIVTAACEQEPPLGITHPPANP